MLELNEEFEAGWMGNCLNRPELITALPVQLYHKFFDYLVQEERWQDVFKITQVKDRVAYQTVDEIVSGAEVIYSPRWTPEQARTQYDRLVDNERNLSDQEFADRTELFFACASPESMISPVKLHLMIRRRVINYCDDRGIPIPEYDGPIKQKFFKNLF